MTFEARRSVDAGLHHLSVRLDPIIAAKLAPILGGLPWTSVLAELDRMRDRIARQYTTTDVQAQLKMITERLGSLRYPFDDHTRIVSALGSELRVMRNRWAHQDELSTLDAWRTHDFVSRLLERLTDSAGAATAVALRDEAFDALVAEQGGGEASKAASEPIDTQVPEPPSATDAELVRPDAVVLDRSSNGDRTPTIGAARDEFEAWNVVQVADRTVLDDLPKKVAKEQVRAVAVEITQFEGPIHIERLAQLTAASFGMRRLFPARAKKLIYQIRQTDVTVDNHGFVWPADVDAESWSEFRPNDSTAERLFHHISPVEVANAIRFLRNQDPGLEGTALDAAVLRTFGRKRRTKQISAHLALAYEVARAM
ncbi:MAG: Swt1 family HEPN domain-containing protein [Cumulibacter sp.]